MAAGCREAKTQFLRAQKRTEWIQNSAAQFSVRVTKVSRIGALQGRFASSRAMEMRPKNPAPKGKIEILRH